MNMKGNTVLVTGGASGIGYRLAEELLSRGNRVIVVGRREDRLARAQREHPELFTRACDVTDRSARQDLAAWIAAEHPGLNVLINNAGIQRTVDLAAGARDLPLAEEEIATNLTALVALTALLVPVLAARPASAVVNVSSGLGFVPIAAMPVYCATKAAVHSFTVSLRHQLRGTSVRVFEVIPPTTDTELDQGRRPSRVRGIPAVDVARAAVEGMERDRFEIPVGEAAGLVDGSRADPAAAFARINRF
jgi:uncharacterized oxidoreductase